MLDIELLDGVSTSLPLDSDGYQGIVSYNITRYSSGEDWQFTRDTVFLTVSVPVSMLGNNVNGTSFYLVKNTSKGAIVYSVVQTVRNGVATFDVPLYYETQSPSMSAVFTLAKEAPVAMVVTPTPSPTPAPMPTPTPVPAQSAGITGNLPILIAVIVIALLVGLVIGTIATVSLFRRYMRTKENDDIRDVKEMVK
jgi:hypothetical protein